MIVRKLLVPVVISLLAVTACQKDNTRNNTISVSYQTADTTHDAYDTSSFYQGAGTPPTEAAVMSPGAVPSNCARVYLYNNSSAANYGISIAANLDASPHSLFLLVMRAYAQASGAGIYTITPNDTVNNIYTDYVQNTSYKITGGSINITQASHNHVVGTFTINALAGTTTRHFTGTINADLPQIGY